MMLQNSSDKKIKKLLKLAGWEIKTLLDWRATPQFLDLTQEKMVVLCIKSLFNLNKYYICVMSSNC